MSCVTFGIDIGTTSICALARDAEIGKVLLSRTRSNHSVIASEEAFARLQDPDAILSTAMSLLEELIEGCGEPASIGITGQMHGILYLDPAGNAVSPLYTWQDARGAEERSEGENYIAYLRRVTGYPVSAGYGLVTHFYQLEHNAVPSCASKICTIHDYLAMKLAGRQTPIVHTSDAASLGFYNLERDAFDLEALRSVGIDPAILPDVTGEDRAPIGFYLGKIPILPAIGDNQASFLGTAGSEGGTLLVNVGTGSQVSMIAPLCKTVPGIECRPFPGNRHLLVGSSLCGGRAYAVLEKFFREVANMCGADISSAYPFMDRLMAEISPEQTLTVSTLFDGTRENPEIRGSINGISVTNLNPAALMDGFLRGIAEELYTLYRDMGAGKIVRMVGAGNGLRLNPALCKIISERFGMPLELSEAKEEAALGAAIFALSAASGMSF